jgi:hypothetical protein
MFLEWGWKPGCQTVYHFVSLLCYCRDSSVGIELGYGLDDRSSRVRFPAGAGNFSLHHRVQNGSGAHPASCPMGTGGSFPGVKRPWREADHSPPSSDEVKNAWTISPLLQYVFMARCLAKHRDNFTFIMLLHCIALFRVGSALRMFTFYSRLLWGRGLCVCKCGGGGGGPWRGWDFFLWLGNKNLPCPDTEHVQTTQFEPSKPSDSHRNFWIIIKTTCKQSQNLARVKKVSDHQHQRQSCPCA